MQVQHWFGKVVEWLDAQVRVQLFELSVLAARYCVLLQQERLEQRGGRYLR